MSVVKSCDFCGKQIGVYAIGPEKFGTHGASLNIYDYFNEVDLKKHNITMDICYDCLWERFDKKDIGKGRYI